MKNMLIVDTVRVLPAFFIRPLALCDVTRALHYRAVPAHNARVNNARKLKLLLCRESFYNGGAFCYF